MNNLENKANSPQGRETKPFFKHHLPADTNNHKEKYINFRVYMYHRMHEKRQAIYRSLNKQNYKEVLR